MTIAVKSCVDCPFASVQSECIAIPYNPLVYSYIAEQIPHPSCPLRTEKITVELENTVTLPKHESSE